MNTSIMNESAIWDEYKYRHDLIWRKVHQFTIIMVSLGTAPYVKLNLIKTGQDLIGLLPIIGTLFGILGAMVLNNELKLYSKIKKVHRALQNDSMCYHIMNKSGSLIKIPFHDPTATSHFTIFLRLYYYAILALSFLNIILLLFDYNFGQEAVFYSTG